MKNNYPFNVPAFDGKIKKDGHTYTWWSWHPYYPYWSKSCWGGETIGDAKLSLSKPFGNSMKNYHNKLIKEEDGKLTEILDAPCVEIELWEKIFKDIENRH